MVEASARLLLVHYTCTQQSLAMFDAMADRFRARGCEVTQSGIELVDKRYAGWLTTSLPIRSFLKAPTTRVLLEGARFADVVVCRRYWGGNHRTVKRRGAQAGGQYVDAIHFVYAGGQIRSLMSLISYLGSGTYRARYFGVPIPRTNPSDAQLGEGRAFARTLANRVAEPASSVRPT
jgi:hypothetical protein